MPTGLNAMTPFFYFIMLVIFSIKISLLLFLSLLLSFFQHLLLLHPSSLVFQLLMSSQTCFLIGAQQPNKCVFEIFCRFWGLSPPSLAQCKGTGKEKSHYHITTPVWWPLTSSRKEGLVAAAIPLSPII